MPANVMVSPFRSSGTKVLERYVTPVSSSSCRSSGICPEAHSWLPVT